MSKQTREYKQKIEIRKTVTSLKTHIDGLAKQKTLYISKAKEAKIKGAESSYSIARSGLKTTLMQLKKSEEMLLNIELVLQYKDFAKVSKSFVGGLNTLSRELSKTVGKMDFAKAEKLFDKAMQAADMSNENLGDMLENNQSTFASQSSVGDVLDNEIDKLIGNEVAIDENDIDTKLDEIIGEKTRSFAERKKRTPIELLRNTYNATKPQTAFVPTAEKPPRIEDKAGTPEDKILENFDGDAEFKFDWDNLPNIAFSDVAGLVEAKDAVRKKVLLPLQSPESYEGYAKKSGGGLLLYGPPGTGKTMIAAAIANEIGAKFCAVGPSDLLHQGMGNSEKSVKALFTQARKYDCAVIFFDEMDSISPKNTKSQYSKNLRSELLRQIQGMDDYYSKNNKILFLIAATNKPWDIDSAFIRPGRFGTRVYVGLPDDGARQYIIAKKLDIIAKQGIVSISDDIDYTQIMLATNGFNGADIAYLLDEVQEISIDRKINNGQKIICMQDFLQALAKVKSSVQYDDIQKIQDWKGEL